MVKPQNPTDNAGYMPLKRDIAQPLCMRMLDLELHKGVKIIVIH